MKQKKIVKIKGGLGNQLFQYTFAKTLEQKCQCDVALDISSCKNCSKKTCEYKLDNFAISLNIAEESDIKSVCLCRHRSPLGTLNYKIEAFIEKSFNRKCFFEKDKLYTDISTIPEYKQFFDGYWQSWEYPFNLKSTLEKELQLTYKISKKTEQFIKKINEEESVFVGVRRGDYSANKKNRSIFGTFSQEYYINAMKIIKSKVKNPVFYIFSNDIEWCKSNLKFDNFNVCFREPDDQFSDVEELIAMSNFKHAIIMNSTFHWWGAFLIKNNEKIVIAPKKWFNNDMKIDIIPPGWIKLERDGKL